MTTQMGRWTAIGVAVSALVVNACAPEETGDEAVDSGVDTPVGTADSVLLDANDATTEQLASIVGQDATDAIMAARPFARVADLHAVVTMHVAEDGLDEVYRALWVPIDLNTASAEEILLIPGVGDRMLHEFEEYRPYASMAQFRLEIGKYVDDEELERLARYVEVR